jgi:hypothetical protein
MKMIQIDMPHMDVRNAMTERTFVRVLMDESKRIYDGVVGFFGVDAVDVISGGINKKAYGLIEFKL